jgi:hypothetical protein
MIYWVFLGGIVVAIALDEFRVIQNDLLSIALVDVSMKSCGLLALSDPRFSSLLKILLILLLFVSSAMSIYLVQLNVAHFTGERFVAGVVLAMDLVFMGLFLFRKGLFGIWRTRLAYSIASGVILAGSYPLFAFLNTRG